MVVPKANPKANKVAANAANPNGIIGRGSLRAALISILTVFHPKESYKQNTHLKRLVVINTQTLLYNKKKKLDQKDQGMTNLIPWPKQTELFLPNTVVYSSQVF